MNLIIDIGNSAAKVAIFNQQHLQEKHVFTSINDLQEAIQKLFVENLIVASVRGNATEVCSWVQAKQKFILTHDLPMPINIRYATPQTLGVDRIAGSCGTLQLFPDQNCLVIDAGTCITYDFTDDAANYHGGGISPGMTMRFEALHTFTAKLPLVTPVNNPPLIGNSTHASIQSGVIQGIIAEMNGIIAQYSNQYPLLRVILCGGDAPFFENKLKASIFASPDLVLLGLNRVLIHNVRS